MHVRPDLLVILAVVVVLVVLLVPAADLAAHGRQDLPWRDPRQLVEVPPLLHHPAVVARAGARTLHVGRVTIVERLVVLRVVVLLLLLRGLVDAGQAGAGLEEPGLLDAARRGRLDQPALGAHRVPGLGGQPRQADDPVGLREVLVGELRDERLGIGDDRRHVLDQGDQPGAADRVREPQHEERERRLALPGLEAVDEHQLPSCRACQSRNSALNSGHSSSGPRSRSTSTSSR